MGNVELLRSLYEAFAQGDVATVFGAMDPNIEWREAESNPYEPSGEPWFGPDAIGQNLFMKLAGEWDVFNVTPKEFHEAGDHVIVEGRYSGTYKETGKSLDAQFCHVWKVRDGKVAFFQQYVDTAKLQAVFPS